MKYTDKGVKNSIYSKFFVYLQVILLIVLAVSSFLAYTLSYFTAQSNKSGELSFANVSVNIIKDGSALSNSSFTSSYLSNLLPGSTININSAQVKNEGTVDTYCLARMAVKIEKSGQSTLNYVNWYNMAGTQVYITNFALNTVGANLLSAGSTANLNIAFTLPTDALNNNYKNSTVTVNLSVYGVQYLLPDSEAYASKPLYAAYFIVTEYEDIYLDSVENASLSNMISAGANYMGEPLRSVQGVSDTIDTAGRQIVRNIGKYECTGDESWYANSANWVTETHSGFFTRVLQNVLLNANYNSVYSYCSHFTSFSRNVLYSLSGDGFGYEGSAEVLAVFKISNTVVATGNIAAWKAYVKSEYDKGTPITIWYQYITPVNEMYLGDSSSRNLWEFSDNHLSFITNNIDGNNNMTRSGENTLSSSVSEYLSQSTWTISLKIKKYSDDIVVNNDISIRAYYKDGTYSAYQAFLNAIPNDSKWHYIYSTAAMRADKEIDYYIIWMSGYSDWTHRNFEIKDIQLELGNSPTDFERYWDGFDGGDGTSVSPYQIATPTQMASLPNYLGDTYSNTYFAVVDNINLAEYLSPSGAGYNAGAGWQPIGTSSTNYFSGKLDGRGHKITGLWINRTTTSNVGFFGYLYNATVSNLGVEISDKGIIGLGRVGGFSGGIGGISNIDNCYSLGDIKGNDKTGGFAGEIEGAGQTTMRSVLIECYASGLVNGTNNVGGFAGAITYGNLTDCYSESTVIASGYACGGFAGSITYYSNSLDCYSSSIVNNTGSNTAGFVGYASAAFSSCGASGTVNGVGYVGGFVGETYYSTFTTCETSSDITASSSYVGGFIGNNDINTRVINCNAYGNVIGATSSAIYVGGFVGFSLGTISGSYAYGYVSASTYVGGFVGGIESGDITTSWSYGSVKGTEFIGGFAGFIGNATISYSSAEGSVIGTISDIGGFAGQIDGGTVSCSYSMGNVNGVTYSGGFVGYAVNATISNTYATGFVNGTSYIGGFIGALDRVSISNSYATGDVTFSVYTATKGGFVGQIYTEAVISNSYAIGMLIENIGFHGFVGSGQNFATITDCYYNQESGLGGNGINEKAVAADVNTFYSSSAAVYSSWNFSSIWIFNGSNVLPILRNT